LLASVTIAREAVRPDNCKLVPVAAPITGVTNVGDVAKTKAPVPVGEVTPDKYPSSVAVVAEAVTTELPLVVNALEAVTPDKVAPAKVGLEPVAISCGVDRVMVPDPWVTVTWLLVPIIVLYS
jgi:hypothetical protein